MGYDGFLGYIDENDPMPDDARACIDRFLVLSKEEQNMYISMYDNNTDYAEKTDEFGKVIPYNLDSWIKTALKYIKGFDKSDCLNYALKKSVDNINSIKITNNKQYYNYVFLVNKKNILYNPELFDHLVNDKFYLTNYTISFRDNNNIANIIDVDSTAEINHPTLVGNDTYCFGIKTTQEYPTNKLFKGKLSYINEVANMNFVIAPYDANYFNGSITKVEIASFYELESKDNLMIPAGTKIKIPKDDIEDLNDLQDIADINRAIKDGDIIKVKSLINKDNSSPCNAPKNDNIITSTISIEDAEEAGNNYNSKIVNDTINSIKDAIDKESSVISCTNCGDKIEVTLSNGKVINIPHHELAPNKNTSVDNHISWDQFFMGVAELAAKRSKDPSTKVGACIVKDNHIISTGYNGMPFTALDNNDKVYPWDRGTTKEDSKYSYVVHAEMNAILSSPVSVRGATMYVTLTCCNECAKAIVQSGITKIIYLNDRDDDIFKIGKKILNNAGVSMVKYSQK